jgi:hypothetical protein
LRHPAPAPSGHDDGELVTAHAGNDVEFPGAAAQAFADELQQLIADVMTQRVVDALELVEIKAQHGQAFAALDPLDLVVELFKQKNTVRQICQCVVTRHVRDTFFRTLTLGHVFVGGQPAAAGNRLVNDRKSPPIRQIRDVVERFSLGDAFRQPGYILIRIAREVAALDSMPEQIAQQAARLYDVRESPYNSI